MNYKIVSKYIKDISFEIPSAEIFTFLDKEISQYTVKCDIKSNRFKKNIIEVSTILKLIPGVNLKRKILAEINMSALVQLEGDLNDKEGLEKIILVDVPSDIYPFLYETFIFLFSKSGIENINIEKNVDFKKLYQENKKNV